jgi:hypothetical protein
LNTVAEVEARYEALKSDHAAAQTALGERRRRVGQGLLACVVAIAWLTMRSVHGGPAWPMIAGFIALVALTPIHLGLQSKMARVQRLIDFYDRSLERVRGEKMQSGNTGEEMRVEGHLYDRDLNLLGEESLFGLLDTVRTGIGQRGLAEYLLHGVSHEESLDRQAAVRELAGMTGLREEIAVLGASKFQQVQARFFDAWLDEAVPEFSPAWRIVLAVTATALIVGLALGLTHVVAWAMLWQPLTLVAVAQAGMVAFLGSRVKPILEATARLSNHVQMFSEGLAVLERQSFISEKLKRVQAAGREPANAVPQLAKLQHQVALVQQRTKELFYVFSALTAAGTQAGIAITAWKRRNGTSMRGWMAAWSEFEALNALANYAFEHPEDVWPELLGDGAARFEATGLGHPLLAECVRNDVSLDASPGTANRFFLISGSNMSGKSTLLRSMGINAVLAYAGAPVRARAMRLTPLRLGAALALTDSLAEGKSKFLAEVERLARIVEASAAAPALFLVDEIFSGTNSADRRTAAGAVVRSLLRRGAIGALSTHDLALAELATADNGGVNVHMASPDPEDPLGFDYTLKPGVNTSSNALAIIRMMGLEAW